MHNSRIRLSHATNTLAYDFCDTRHLYSHFHISVSQSNHSQPLPVVNGLTSHLKYLLAHQYGNISSSARSSNNSAYAQSITRLHASQHLHTSFQTTLSKVSAHLQRNFPHRVSTTTIVKPHAPPLLGILLLLLLSVFTIAIFGSANPNLAPADIELPLRTLLATRDARHTTHNPLGYHSSPFQRPYGSASSLHLSFSIRLQTPLTDRQQHGFRSLASHCRDRLQHNSPTKQFASALLFDSSRG